MRIHSLDRRRYACHLKESINETVRLIDIDASEPVHPNISRNTELGHRSAEYAKELLEGQKLRIEMDAQERDRYGRLLAYVYLEDGTMVNEKLLQDGMAQGWTVPPNVRMRGDFCARKGMRGKRERGFGRSRKARSFGRFAH